MIQILMLIQITLNILAIGVCLGYWMRGKETDNRVQDITNQCESTINQLEMACPQSL